jgi:starch-binding outer membrane protein, SusD/RagB family
MTTIKLPQTLRRACILAAFAATVGIACSPSEVLDITDPDIIDPTAVNSAAGAVALYAGAIGDFSFGIVGDNGGQEGLIEVGGMITDEMMHTETFPTRLEYELRAIDDRNGTLLGIFRQVQRSRASADAAVPLLRQYAPTPASRVGEMFAISGMIYTFVGETYCSGVPFSTAYPTVTYGMPQTTDQIFTTAAAKFDSALANAGGSAAITNLARIGKGRALLNLGQFANAAAAVAAVPLDFSYNTTHNTNSGRQQNGIHVFNYQSERWGVSDAEGTNGLNFRGAADPRVKAIRSPATNVGFDNVTPQWNLRKYPSPSARLPIAQGVEAKLIIAEALLQAGNVTAWLDTLNFLRTNIRQVYLNAVDSLIAVSDTAGGTTAPLPALADPGTAAGRQDLLFRERAFWLYVTGHRLGDLRRLIRQYGRGAETVFPTGTHFKGTPYGPDVNVPVPFNERNNPNFSGCINRGA